MIMLELSGVDVNACSESTEPGLLIAAKYAQGEVLKTLLDHEKTDICIYGDMGTILHYILNTPLPHRPQKDYELALQQMLSSGSNLTKFRLVCEKMGCEESPKKVHICRYPLKIMMVTSVP